jgi:hypothetical protein
MLRNHQSYIPSEGTEKKEPLIMNISLTFKSSNGQKKTPSHMKHLLAGVFLMPE